MAYLHVDENFKNKNWDFLQVDSTSAGFGKK